MCLGSLGDVIKESAQIALSWVKAHAYLLKIAPSRHTNIVENYDIHIHVPGGAVPKDGPSAGKALPQKNLITKGKRRITKYVSVFQN